MRRLLVFVGLIALAVVAAGAWWSLRGGHPPLPLQPAAKAGSASPVPVAPGGQPTDPALRPASLAEAIKLSSASAALDVWKLPEPAARQLAQDTQRILDAIADETTLTFEDLASRKRLSLPRGLARGTDEQRLAFWRSTTDYFRNLDIDITSAVVLVRGSRGKLLAGPQPGRTFSVRVKDDSEAPSDEPVYEIVFAAVVRSGDGAGSTIRFGVWMVKDAPDGSWRSCGVSHYDVPQGQSRTLIPSAFPPK
ncbi:MAG: hypothetical protein ACKVS8_04870 [Phycisphaerales bacterium]